MAVQKSNPGVINIDMTGVEAGGLVPEGDYFVAVEKVTSDIAQSSGKPMLKWEFRVTQGKNKGSKLYYNTSLQPQALFNLKNVLTCLGIQVPSSLMSIKLATLIGKICGVTVDHEEYDKKTRAKISAFFPYSEDEAEEDSDEAEEVEETEEAEEEAEEEETVDLDSMKLAELVAYAKEQKISLKPLAEEERKRSSNVRAYIKSQMSGEDM